MKIHHWLLAIVAVTLASPTVAAEPWQKAVAAALGKAGSDMPDGVYRVGLPRSDLKVSVDGVELKPSLALGSWLAFMPHGDATMVMGDLVLTDEEVSPVMKRLVHGGIAITALHNHLLRGAPHTMYMHVEGHGDAALLATTLREALAQSRTPMTAPPAATAPPPPLAIDTAAIDRALGVGGRHNGGVYSVSIPRADAPRAGGMVVPDAMGSAIAINFQPTGGGRAAVTGDFVLAADEVNPVILALRTGGIEVTALHNHMLDDEPRLFFMHFWANDDATRLAGVLRTAVDRIKVRRN